MTKYSFFSNDSDSIYSGWRHYLFYSGLFMRLCSALTYLHKIISVLASGYLVFWLFCEWFVFRSTVPLPLVSSKIINVLCGYWIVLYSGFAQFALLLQASCFLRTLYLSIFHIWDQHDCVWVCSPPMAFHRHRKRWPWMTLNSHLR